MSPLLQSLAKDLDRDIGQQLSKRFDALQRHYRYLRETENKYLQLTLRNGWFDEKYEALFALNSFFQIVIGPLASSTRGTAVLGIGSEIPITYGSAIRFDHQRNLTINEVYSDFKKLLEELHFEMWWVQANQASDAIYSIAKNIEENVQKE